MRFNDVKTFLDAGLTADPKPLINPGPATDSALQKLSPQSIVFATIGNGAGLTTEALYDSPFITIRVIGPQGSYDKAEALAYEVDRLFLAVGGTTKVGDARALYITRTGGAPTLIDHDNADRYHFQCSYITETKTGL